MFLGSQNAIFKGYFGFFLAGFAGQKIFGVSCKKITLFVNIRREAPKKIGFLGSQNAIFKGVFDFFLAGEAGQKILRILTKKITMLVKIRRGRGFRFLRFKSSHKKNNPVLGS